MWALISGVVGLIVGFFIATKISKSDHDNIVRLLTSQKEADQNTYLFTLLRSLSHVLMAKDLEKYCGLRIRTLDEVKKLKSYTANLKASKLSLISERYPYIADFDIMNVKEFILPLDAASTLTFEELAEAYEDIHVFLAASNTADDLNEFSNRNNKFFKNYVQRIKDTNFKQRVLREMSAFLNTKSINDINDFEYKLKDVEIIPISHFAENRHGLHFKDIDEYAIYGVFYDDDLNAYESIYRSDKTFEIEKPLETLFTGLIYEKQLENLK